MTLLAGLGKNPKQYWLLFLRIADDLCFVLLDNFGNRVLSQMIGLAPWERTFVSLLKLCAPRIGDLFAMLFAFLID